MKLEDGAKLSIVEVGDDGKPLKPENTCRKYVAQCGAIVRDIIPITLAEWNEPKKANVGASYVDDRLKQTLWDSILSDFSLPEGLPEKKLQKVREWTLKKMATQFNSWKKKLWKKYEKKTPEFKGSLLKIKDDWPAFVAYKKSAVALARSERNKENAKKKKYHHTLGSGGYKTALPKWESFENELRLKGITPQTDDWPERSKYWLFAHGAVLDPETGLIVAKGKWKKRITRVVKKLEKAIAAVREGTFVPNREDDELTLALGNPEHWGRCRGRGGGVGFLHGFPADVATYKSRSRSKKKEADRLSQLERQVHTWEAQVKRQQEQLDSITQQRESRMVLEDPPVDVCPSQRKSSVGSTHLEYPAVDEPAAHYPVDDITEKTNCELHVPMKNISYPVAKGYALQHQPGATFHFGQIPAGYARVGVTKVMPGFHSMELDIPGNDDEKTLGEVEHGIVLWKKKYIIFTDSTPRPPTPPGRNLSPKSPPAFRDDWVPTASPSPAPSRQPTDAPTSHVTKRSLFRKDRSPVIKRAKKTHKLKSPEKLAPEKPACEMTMEEITVSLNADAATFFERRKEEKHAASQDPLKELLKTIPIEVKDRTIDNLYNPPPAPFTDYERGINKVHSSQMEEEEEQRKQKKCGKQVAQLGEQEVQSMAPLIVSSRAPQEIEPGEVVYRADREYETLEIAYQYTLGLPLVTNPSALTTQLWRLHNWYMDISKDGTFYFMAGVKDEHYFQEYAVQVEFSELFQMYNQRALDKSIISCYCL